MEKYNKVKGNILFSISIAGILLALIIVLNFFLEPIKIWVFSIQAFLIIYAIGIYKISNWIVNIFFLIVVPPILFAFEQGVYAINGLQVFFEYFLVFYLFAFLYLSRLISSCFLNKKRYKLYSFFIFIISFSMLICAKYLLHSLASLTFWGQDVWGALVYNVPWLVTNLITIPIAIVITYPIFEIFDKYNDQRWNKW